VTVDGAHKAVIMEFVYILKCNDGTYYTGHTNNLEERMKRHNKGENTYTKPRRPVEIITYLAFSDKYKAFAFEKYLKSGSGKAFCQKRLV
jgi:predicted GIY-YIG superfamily endonuclease